jgi:hypothetical protein
VERQIEGWLCTKAFNFRIVELSGLKVGEEAQPMYVNTWSVFLRICSFVPKGKKAWLGLKGSFSVTNVGKFHSSQQSLHAMRCYLAKKSLSIVMWSSPSAISYRCWF